MTVDLFPLNPTALPLWVALGALAVTLAVVGGCLVFAFLRGAKKEARPPEEGPTAEL